MNGNSGIETGEGVFSSMYGNSGVEEEEGVSEVRGGKSGRVCPHRCTAS